MKKLISEQPICQTCLSRHSGVFCDLSEEQTYDINNAKSSTQFKKGEIIFMEGNSPLGLYCINKGKIKVSKTGNEGREQIVRLAKAGDILGYRALISGGAYSATATALEDSTVCFIKRQIFFDMLKVNHGFSSTLMKQLSEDLKKAEHKIMEFVQKPTGERISETLVILKEFYGFEKDGSTINSTLSRENIASISGTTTETTIRYLTDLKKKKILDLTGKKIKINDLQQLLNSANIQD